jgi:hypothetical protein
VPDLKFNPSLLVLLASIHSEVCYFCLPPQSQAIAVGDFLPGSHRGETAPDRRKSRRCADLHGRLQPIYRNRCCSARVSHVRDHLCIFRCVRACRCVAGRERGAINLVSDFGRGCLISYGDVPEHHCTPLVRSLTSRSGQHLIVVTIRQRGYSGSLLLLLQSFHSQLGLMLITVIRERLTACSGPDIGSLAPQGGRLSLKVGCQLV